MHLIANSSEQRRFGTIKGWTGQGIHVVTEVISHAQSEQQASNNNDTHCPPSSAVKKQAKKTKVLDKRGGRQRAIRFRCRFAK